MLGFGTRKTPAHPVSRDYYSEHAAARKRFCDALGGYRELLLVRARNAEEAARVDLRKALAAANSISYGHGIPVSARADLLAVFELEVGRVYALFKERMSKVNENRHDAWARLENVESVFSQAEHPAVAVEAAIDEMKQIYATPLNGFAFVIYEDCKFGSDVPATPFPRYYG
jgi:hypothetical protein